MYGFSSGFDSFYKCQDWLIRRRVACKKGGVRGAVRHSDHDRTARGRKRAPSRSPPSRIPCGPSRARAESKEKSAHAHTHARAAKKKRQEKRSTGKSRARRMSIDLARRSSKQTSRRPEIARHAQGKRETGVTLRNGPPSNFMYRPCNLGDDAHLKNRREVCALCSVRALSSHPRGVHGVFTMERMYVLRESYTWRL